MLKQITIIGVGLIGGSLARALRRCTYCQTIVGFGRQTEHLQLAQRLGVIDHYETSLGSAVNQSDMVVLAVPVGQMGSLLQQLSAVLEKGAVVTDVGSVKGSVVAAARGALGDMSDFVPGHPIAGTEKSGVAASFASLFENRRVILTPLPENATESVRAVTDMWQATGATVIDMDMQHHDEVLAASSHLPHVLAYNLVDSLARMSKQKEIFEFAAGGFRDFTRIASSDPSMWVDISLANQQALLGVLNQYRHDLDRLIQAVRDQDGEVLQDIYQNAKITRDRYCQEQDYA